MLRILLLADSHLGFDLPTRPRVSRRRRGHDFLDNYAAALAPAARGEVDVVVHGGDVFHRPRVPPSLAYQALEPLAAIADRGVPVFVVPGNHERARLPHARFAAHPRVHVFDAPRTYVVELRGVRLALSGFPFERRAVRTRFPELLERTGWREQPADVRLLCIHQCVEGATVGPQDFTFTTAADVIRGADLPRGFAAVLSGHIHRQQVLTRDLRGGLLPAPVLYPGSLERTSVAETGEPKGYMIVQLAGAQASWEFRELPTRPFLERRLTAEAWSEATLDTAVRALVAAAPRDAVLRVRVEGRVAADALRAVAAAHLRSYAPATLNVEVRVAGAPPFSRARPRGAAGCANLQLDL